MMESDGCCKKSEADWVTRLKGIPCKITVGLWLFHTHYTLCILHHLFGWERHGLCVCVCMCKGWAVCENREVEGMIQYVCVCAFIHAWLCMWKEWGLGVLVNTYTHFPWHTHIHSLFLFYFYLSRPSSPVWAGWQIRPGTLDLVFFKAQDNLTGCVATTWPRKAYNIKHRLSKPCAVSLCPFLWLSCSLFLPPLLLCSLMRWGKVRMCKLDLGACVQVCVCVGYVSM